MTLAGGGVQGWDAPLRSNRGTGPVPRRRDHRLPADFLRAIATASARDDTPSFARIAETWWSTVLVETNRRFAMTELRRPSDKSARISVSRFVRPNELLRVDFRERRGMPRTP